MSYPPESGGGGNTTGLDIQTLFVTPITTTSVEITVSRSEQTKDPTKYKVKYQKLYDTYLPNGSPVYIDFPVTDPENDLSFSVTNLTEGALYSFTVTAYKNSEYGNSIGEIIRMNLTTFNGKVVGGGLSPEKISSSKGFLQITGPSVKNQFAIATKEFSGITLPSSTTAPISSGYWYVDEAIKSYGTRYYSFGTSLFFDSTTTKPKQGGGIGFFTNSEGTEGYYILLETTALSASQDRKTIRIVKCKGNKIYKLKDSQRTTTSTFEGLYGGVQYDIDIKVKVSSSQVYIVAYINGFRVSAVDEFGYNATTKITNYIASPTKNVSVFCSQGTVSFDYVYGLDIDKKIYEDSDYQYNFYKGQFSNDLINSLYGDLVYTGNYGQDVYSTNKKSVEEFGTTVREITKATVRFPSRPSFPVKWGVGNNQLVSIISSKVSNFGAEAYVLNNSSITVPLSDNNQASFYIIGNTLAPSGQLEYSTDEAQTYTTKEPVIFESRWLQNLEDVKNLADWIKSNIVNKGKVVNITTFGNPLISVGDIVTIDYAYQGFDGTEKFIVTNINQTYSEGLETTITCRLIVN